MSDNVNHPQHYIRNGLETIDVIKAFTSNLVGMEAVCTGNALKYLCRWKEKNGLEDLKKAEWYLKRLISEVEANGEGTETPEEILKRIADAHWEQIRMENEHKVDPYTLIADVDALEDKFKKLLSSRARENAVYALHIQNVYAYDMFWNWYRTHAVSYLYKGTVLIDYHGTNFENDDIAAYDSGKIEDYAPYDLPERSNHDELWLVCPTALFDKWVVLDEDGRPKAPDEVRFEICIFDRDLPSPKTLNTLFYGGDSGPIMDVVPLELFDRS